MTARHILCVVTLALLIGCASETGEESPGGIDLAGMLTDPSSLEGWNLAEGPTEYLPENLYEYMDGAAPRFLAYGFRKLIHVRYELGGDVLSSVTFDILDMGSKLGAFGIYRNGMPLDAVLQQWGTEGYRSGTVAAAWKDGIFVQASADDDRIELIGVLERLMAGVCSEIVGDESLPAILNRFPSDGLVPLSERYTGADLFGHTFLPGGLTAEYESDGQGAELFFSDLGSEVAAGEAIASLRAYHSEWDSVIQEVPSFGRHGYRFSDPGLGPGIAVVVSEYVAGVYGDLETESQLRLLGILVDRLGAPR
jgi:hypothetical protein